jgi:cytochrome P450
MLNERIMGKIWEDASKQTHDMVGQMERLISASKTGAYNRTFEDMKTITINVIASVGFGTARSFSGATTAAPPEGFKTTPATSVVTLVNNLYLAVFVPVKLLLLPIMPKAVRKVGVAKMEFPLHLNQSITEERRSPMSTNSLVASLVRLADDSDNATAKSSFGSSHLTEEEITGNLFVFTVAGFDTTANTLSYAIMMLAIYPEWQDWLTQEVDEAAKIHPNGEYSDVFPLLTRCLAFMVE